MAGEDETERQKAGNVLAGAVQLMYLQTAGHDSKHSQWQKARVRSERVSDGDAGPGSVFAQAKLLRPI
jgi:hypothetical protein